MPFTKGYFSFHPNTFINYQLNRWYALGAVPKQELEAIAARIHSFGDYVEVFLQAAQKALSESRLQQAATYLRAAEFLIEPGDERKIPIFEHFIEVFDQAHQGQAFERKAVPYQGSYLSVLRFPNQADTLKGYFLAIGGFDSYIEDFLLIWQFLSENGYEVLAFEGPGQGTTRRKYGLTFDHDWEKPSAAILDYFDISEAIFMGISMGGYWAIRAGAFEKRIKSIIAMPPVYDWMETTHVFNHILVRLLLKIPVLLNTLVRLKMKAKLIRHAVQHTMFIIGKNKPIDAIRWMLGMNKTHLNSDLVTQHVLLIGGEKDAFQPPLLLKKQEKALVNARSITSRVFTRAEEADQHCQIGNLALVMHFILNWLDGLEATSDRH